MVDAGWTQELADLKLTKGEAWELRAFALQAWADEIGTSESFCRTALSKLDAAIGDDRISGECVTLGCFRLSVASVRLEDGDWHRYCEDCAEVLERGGDETKWDEGA